MSTKRVHGFTLVELLVVIAIIGILIALLLPAVQMARAAARRVRCTNNLKQIGLGLLSFEESYQTFPAGATAEGIVGPWTYDILAIAHTGEGGYSWMLDILPFIEHQAIYDQWDFSRNASQNALAGQTDIPTFYCTSRRNSTQNSPLMFDGWTKGGTDYGGCIGSGNAFGDGSYSNYGPYNCNHFVAGTTYQPHNELNDPRVRGLFFPNEQRRMAEITDGTSHTLLTGELQRLDRPDDGCSFVSQDGWAIGGVGTLFSADEFQYGGGVNNGFYENPGSDHPGGAFFGMADGSVAFVSEDADTIMFENLGTYANGEVASLEMLLD